MHWGALITRALDESGLTIAQLAAKSGFSAETISEWEYAHESPTLDEFERLMRAAGMRISWAIERDDGIDVSQIEESLRLTPDERLERLRIAAEFALELREGVAKYRSR